MKRVLIISPHFPPSNLAAVHRSRLFAQHLPEFGWEPVVLTIHEKFYEEEPDWNLAKLLPPELKVEKTGAFPLTRPRTIGDIGLRGLLQLYRRALQLIRKEKIDFLYIPIPSFYVALLGRWLHGKTGVPYGIDYIDPWVHRFPGSDRRFSRHWFSTRLAEWLEPIAVKRSSVITGVAEGYYKEVLVRNPHLQQTCLTDAMPYGGEERDHRMVKTLAIQPYLFKKDPSKTLLVYAGAMLPKAYAPLEAIMQAMVANPAVFEKVQIHFIGTGKTPSDPEGYNIRPMAEKYDLWQKNIFEYPARIPYLDVLSHLEAASGVFILGSTEAHYTPSKVYQAVLSDKPIMAVLHTRSTATEVIRATRAGVVLDFDGEAGVTGIADRFAGVFGEYQLFAKSFSADKVDKARFGEYSARAVTGRLAALLDRAILLPSK